MSWNPKFKFLPLAPFRRNVQTVIERDMAAALTYFAPTGMVLPDVQGIFTARAIREMSPVVILLPLGNDPVSDDDNSYDEKKRLLVEVEHFGRDPDILIEELEYYNLALRSILTEMSEADLVGDIPVALENGFRMRDDFRWTIGTERFGEREYDSENSFVLVASQILTINYMEVETTSDE
jgi:hypothetical protein